MSQLSLLPPPLPDPDGERFVLSTGNQQAARFVESWPAWPGPTLALAGPEGSGKSLLAGLWANRASAARLGGQAIDAQTAMNLAYAGQPILLDPPGALPEESLLHLLNVVAERRGSLLLVDRAPPAQWPVKLPDLASRLAALPVATLDLPDDALLRAILVKKFSARQLRVGAELLDFILSRCERSPAAVEAVAERLDSAALAQGKSITLPFARALLAQSNET